MVYIFERKNGNDDDTYLGAVKAKLGAAKSRLGSSGGGGSILFTVIFTLAIIAGLFYVNFKAMGMATGATGPIVKHGLGYTFLQPFYSLWAIYYVLLGHKKA